MKIKVIGCHGSVEPSYLPSCYQVNDSFFIDAGSMASALTPAQQSKVTDVVLTHPHLDHIKDLAFLIENSADANRDQLVIHSTQAILDDVHKHIFNDVIWPDFSKVIINTQSNMPLLKFQPIQIGQKHKIGSISLEPFRVNHPGNAVGFLIDDGKSEIIMTGDTGPCPLVWEKANQCSRLKAVFTEISFPSRMDRLATISGHYTLRQLMTDLSAFKKQQLPIYISHFKPKFMGELIEEFHLNAPQNLKLMHEGDEFDFV